MPRGQYTRRPTAEPVIATAPTPIEPSISPRAAEVRRERRLRNPGDLDRMAEMKLAIPPEVQERLTREGKTARWVLDRPNRLQSVARRDWDVTPDVAPVPDGNDGLNLVLHEKYQDWFDEDQKAKGSRLDETDQAIARGQIDGSGKATPQDDFNRELAKGNRIGR